MSYPRLKTLQQATEYLETILNHISQGIVFIALDGIIMTYNKAAEQALGVSKNRVLFNEFWNCFPDDLFHFSMREALNRRSCPEISFMTRKWPNGKQFELEITPSFIHQEASDPIQGLLIRIRNITEVRRLQVMADRHDRLKEIGEIAAKVAHEIRNPLGGIKGFASLLQKDLKGNPELEQLAASIVEGTESLTRLVNSILNYTRPIKPEFQPTDLVLFLEEIRQHVLADRSWNKNVQFHIHSQIPHLTVPIDSALFKGALLNLIFNAVQAMPNGGVFEMTLDQEDNEAILVVNDTGVGISAENREKIFTPFFSTKSSGNGLGLSEVHKVVHAHRGTIDVQSEVNVGTTFTIKIPLNI